MTQTTTQSGSDQPVNLSDCDREPIHLLGGVQAYGCLISTSADMMVNHVSDNLASVLGLDPDRVIGVRLTQMFPEETLHAFRTKLQLISSQAGVVRLFGFDVMQTGKLFDVSIHLSGASYVFEFEPKVGQGQRDDLSVVMPLVGRVKQAESVQLACEEAASAVAILSGFDRVMVYRFAEDGAGEVIAERRSDDMEPYLGLRFPASDIPRQARELYKRSLLRLIADVNGEVSALVPQANPQGEPLDLSLAVTRSVSPIHLQYLRNMGVDASMSVSILKDDELWGLIACHHKTPHYVDYERRTAIELFTQFFSYELVHKIELAARAEEAEARSVHDRLMIRLSSGDDFVEGFDVLANELSRIIPCDGIAVFSEGRYRARGEAPSRNEFEPLSRFLNTAPIGQVYSVDNLAKVYSGAEALGDRVAGMLAVPISRSPRDYIVFFRREVARSVIWGGNPNKPVQISNGGKTLTPRNSFAEWKELVRGACAPWTESELRGAEALRVSLIEIVLKLTDEANTERRKAAEKQELLIAELNHRVRNILNLIQGLVSQGQVAANDLDTYKKVLDQRVQALARAHDQLTRKEWSAISLVELIEVEAEAYLDVERERVRLSGVSPMLEPEAFTSLALVVHELITNAAKYGALTGPAGTIHVDMRFNEDGALRLEWREVGGPPVQAPTRRGFGSTVIEKTIPYELGGSVDIRYLLSGFEADIVLPARVVRDGAGPQGDQGLTTKSQASPKAANDAPTAQLSGEVLVLEDNMIVALDASETLKRGGATKTHMASTVEEALSILDRAPISFALLDVNLRDQTSLAVAQTLRERGVPYLLATGYGDADSIVSGYPENTTVITKPFTPEILLQQAGKKMGEIG